MSLHMRSLLQAILYMSLKIVVSTSHDDCRDPEVMQPSPPINIMFIYMLNSYYYTKGVRFTRPVLHPVLWIQLSSMTHKYAVKYCKNRVVKGHIHLTSTERSQYGKGENKVPI